MSELEIYKVNRIRELTSILNGNISRLNSALTANINKIQQQPLYSQKVKQQQINLLVNQYNNNVKTLMDIYNKNKISITNFKPNSINIYGSKKALLIGINYKGTSNKLFGCINDTILIKERIMKNGFKNENIIMINDDTQIKPTKVNILNNLTNVLKSANKGDFIFFGYSGHGSYTKDLNGDELTGYDQMIIPIDLNPIVDDELKSIIQNNLKDGVTLFAMFDSCFSGSVLDLRYQYVDSLNYDKYTENLKEIETKGDVFMISGCNDCQTSADAYINGKSNGAMTWSLLEALKQKQNCSWRELIKEMRDLLKTNGYEQIPQFSTGNFENIDLPVFV